MNSAVRTNKKIKITRVSISTDNKAETWLKYNSLAIKAKVTPKY